MQDNSIKTGDIATVPAIPPVSRGEAQIAEFHEILQATSPRMLSIIGALLLLASGKTPQGEPLTEPQRSEALALVLPELEKLRAKGSPDADSFLSEIMEGGKRA
jgi:hypothetical protein